MSRKKQETRTCRICHEVKPLDQFEKDSRYKGGLSTRCRACKQALNNKAYKAFYRLRDRFPKYGVEIETNKEEVEQIFEMFDDKCMYCGKEESEETGTFHLEHIRPLSQGGRNHVSNLCISCGDCNFKKNTKPVYTFYQEHSRWNYDYMPFLIKYIGYFSKRSEDEVEAELITEHKAYCEVKASG